MDILAKLPDTHAGRHTQWSWSRMLGIAGGSPPPNPEELAEHFAPCFLELVPTDQILAQWTQFASTILRITHMVEDYSSDQCYSALLNSPEGWLRYSCHAQDDEPHLLAYANWIPSLDPYSYSDQRVQRDGRDVQIRDFGGTGPLMLLWHGAGGDLTNWETMVPFLADFRVIAQDLPGHGRSRLKLFTTDDALADADAVTVELDLGPPVIAGHSLGGYLGLRYAASRACSGWIGLDGPLGLVYPWDISDSGFSETDIHFCREMIAIDVVRDLAAINCPAMLLPCVSSDPTEEEFIPGRRKLAEHIARHHPKIRIEWVQTGHDTMLFDRQEETAATIRDFLSQSNVDASNPAGK